MRTVSAAFLNTMQERTDFTCRASITFYPDTENESTIEIGADRFTVQNNGFTDSAASDTFPLGEAICRTIQLELMNDDEYFSSYDFFGAKIILFLDFEITSTNTESLRIGKYTVLTPATYGETVIVSAADDMWKADKPYLTYLEYPSTGRTLQEIFVEACNLCEIDPGNTQFQNYSQTVLTPPSSEYTFRQVFGYIAMIAGGNARIDYNGYMQIVPYSFADGETVQADYTLENWFQLNVDTNDITITGIQTTRESLSTEEDEETTEETILVGEYGYVLSIENPLVTGKEEAMLTLIGNAVIGYPFRKFDGQHIAFPIAEFMDKVKIKDRKGNIYYSVLTDIDFMFGTFTSFFNSAENAIQTNSSFPSPVQKVIAFTRKLMALEKGARERAIENATERITSAIQGYIYFPENDDPYGLEPGQMLIMDAEVPSDAANVWRWNLNGLGYSSTGVNGTYETAITSDGRIVADFITTGTLTADVILAGVLSAGNGKSWINMETGAFSFGNSAINYDGTTLEISASSIQKDGVSVASEDDLAEVKDELKDQIDDIVDTLEKQNGFIRIAPLVPSITLGKEGARASVVITNETVTISGSDGAEAVLESSKLSAEQAAFKHTNMGKWLWVSRTVNGAPDQNLSLKWVGE